MEKRNRRILSANAYDLPTSYSKEKSKKFNISKNKKKEKSK